MSARKQRSGGRGHVKGKESFTEREEESGTEKSKQKKRKLSDLLGPPWSEEDLKHFYQSYRHHGRDWKKVAASFQNRTVEMVEVLYKMNKAYLSLPEGAASAAGLIAMMTDHCNILEESNSFGDDDDSSNEILRSPPPNPILSRSRNTSPMLRPVNRSKIVPQVSGISSYGGPSPSKKPRTVAMNRPRAVGKRTPRVPLIHFQDKKSSEKLLIVDPMEDQEQDSFGECDEMKVALTLAASASQRVASPQISRTPLCNASQWRNSPAQNGCDKHVVNAGSESSDNNNTGSNMDGREDGESEESRDIESDVVTKGITDSRKRYMHIGERKSRTRRVPKSLLRKGKLQGFDKLRSDDLKEECSCTDEGTTKREDVKMGDGFVNEHASKKKRLPSQKTKNRSRQLFCGDERNGLDALATLADLCFLPSPRRESGDNQASHAHISYGPSKGIGNMNSKDGLVGRSKESFARLNVNGKMIESETQKSAEFKKRKRRVVSEKRDQFSDGNGELEEKGSVHSEELINQMKAKRTFLGQTPSKYVGRPVKQEPEQEPETQEVHVGEFKLKQVPILDVVKLPLKQRTRRKTKYATESVRTIIPHSVLEENSSDKIRLLHCLSSEKVRQWCIYEWFYSAIDVPWFSRNEFVEYLNHAGLGHVPRLTRAEWGVIRGSLGKPRRLSKRFLEEEREKLETYRNLVRKHYQDVRMGHLGGLPIDLPRPLMVGQRVIARHPKTKEHCKGSILTVDWNKCRVQFELQEMGVELVADVDCMPINSLENVSDTLLQKSSHADLGNHIEDSKFGVQSLVIRPAPESCLNERHDKHESVPGTNSSNSLLNALCNQAQAADTADSVMQVKVAANEAVLTAQQAVYNQSLSSSQLQAREADIRALADLTRALDKKEALLLELRNMNDDAASNKKDGEVIRRSDMFQKHYATLLLQIKEVNQQVCEALLHLRQRNKYRENCMPPWQRQTAQHSTGSTHSGSLETTNLSLEQFPLAREVTKNAKEQAKLMVNNAVETMLCVKEGEDGLSKMGMAFSQLPKKPNLLVSHAEIGKVDTSVPKGGRNSTGFQDWTNPDLPQGATKQGSTGKEPMCLADLMSTCVATLLMVQAFTERQYPPAEIAMAFDTVLVGLQPCSSQNYPIYTEIQHYASLLKNQIIALIPTQSLHSDYPLPHS